MTRTEFMQQIARLQNYFAASLKHDQIEAYWESLKHLPQQTVSSAVSTLIDDEEQQRIPSPVQIYRIAKKHSPTQNTTDDNPHKLTAIQHMILSLEQKPVKTQNMLRKLDILKTMLNNYYPINQHEY